MSYVKFWHEIDEQNRLILNLYVNKIGVSTAHKLDNIDTSEKFHAVYEKAIPIMLNYILNNLDEL